ncbi:hypothetical protein [Streptomyces sp. NPDC054849]
MSDEQIIHTVEIADGTIHIKVLMAERKTYTNWDGNERREVEELQARAWVSTDPEFKSDTDLGFVKIRGRKYAIEHVIKRLPEGRGYLDRHGIAMKWQSEASYRGGYRNDRGSQVSYDAKAYGQLGEIEREALNQFEKDNPMWITDSIRLLFEYERNHLEGKAKRKRDEAKQHEAEAAKWQARIDELLAA